MREELRTYYERELSYLRQLGSEFADKYPKIASRLALDADGSQDPHVERLIEAFAFLTARIRHKIDDELPEITDTLLGILYPHYLAPIPSMSIVAVPPRPEPGAARRRLRRSRATRVVTRVRCAASAAASGRPTRSTLWPLEVPTPDSRARSRRSRSARCAISAPARWSACGCARWAAFRSRSCARRRLRCFLQGEGQLAAGLYELLCGGALQVELHATRRDRPRAAGAAARRAPARSASSADEALLPYPPHVVPRLRSPRGVLRLSREVPLPRPGRARRAPRTRARQTRSRSASSPSRAPRSSSPSRRRRSGWAARRSSTSSRRPAEPIWLDHTKAEYRVVPDVARAGARTRSTRSTGRDRRRASRASCGPCISLLRVPPRHDGGAGRRFWLRARGRQSARTTARRDVYLRSSTSTSTRRRRRPRRSPSHVTCTNRDLPSPAPVPGTIGADLEQRASAPFVRVPLPRQADRHAAPPLPARRALAARLAPRAEPPLAGRARGRRRCAEILGLYDFADSSVTRQQIAG